MRTTREKTPVLYDTAETFPIGGSKVVRQSDDDQVTVIGAGITLHEALKAADELAAEGINVRVIDLYSVKPIDFETLHTSAAATGGRLVVVEDHWGEGGLGSAVLECFATHSATREDASTDFRMTHLHPTDLAGSATPAQQLDVAGISAKHIVAAVKAMV